MPQVTIELDDETAARLLALAGGMPHRQGKILAQLVDAEWLRRDAGIVGLAQRLEEAERELERLRLIRAAR